MKETSVRTRVLVAALAAFGFGCASSGGEATIDGAQVTVRELLTLDAFDAYVAFSPDGRTLATGIRGENPAPPGELKLWDVATGELLATMMGHSSGILSVAFSSDGRTVATGGLDNTVRLWDVATRRLRHTLIGHQSQVVATVFSPDGRTVASSAGDQIRLWDVVTGRERTPLLGGFRDLDPVPIYAIAFSPDGKSLASASNHRDTSRRESVGRLTLWDLATGERRSLYRVVGRAGVGTRSGGVMNAVAFSPDGQTLAAGRLLFDVASGDRLHQRRGRNRGGSLAFSPDGKILVTGSYRTLTFWDAEMGTRITEIYAVGPSGVTSVAFSPDGTKLAVGMFEANTKIYGITRENVR